MSIAAQTVMAFTTNGQHAAVWQGKRIIIAETEVFDGPIVRHEMLHALLQMAGARGV